MFRVTREAKKVGAEEREIEKEEAKDERRVILFKLVTLEDQDEKRDKRLVCLLGFLFSSLSLSASLVLSFSSIPPPPERPLTLPLSSPSPL